MKSRFLYTFYNDFKVERFIARLDKLVHVNKLSTWTAILSKQREPEQEKYPQWTRDRFMTVNLSNFKREDYVKQFWMYNYQVTLPKSKVAQNRHWRGSDYVLKGPGEILCPHLATTGR